MTAFNPERFKADLDAATVESFRSSDSYEWFFRRWPCIGNLRARIIALHGIQSHSGWYAWSSCRLAERGVEVLFLDRRGSGLNQKLRGHAPHPDRLVNDVIQFLRHLRCSGTNGAVDSVPMVLLGLSWGARLAAAVAGRVPDLLDGLILLYPGIFSRFGPSFWQKSLLRLAVEMDKVDRLVDSPLDDPGLFASDSSWQQFIADDPLALRSFSAGFLAAGVQLGDEAATAVERTRLPLLMMLAGRDQIVDNRASMECFGRSQSPCGTLIRYPEATHTLEFDACRDQFVHDLYGWLGGLDHRPTGQEIPNLSDTPPA